MKWNQNKCQEYVVSSTNITNELCNDPNIFDPFAPLYNERGHIDRTHLIATVHLKSYQVQFRNRMAINNSSQPHPADSDAKLPCKIKSTRGQLPVQETVDAGLYPYTPKQQSSISSPHESPHESPLVSAPKSRHGKQTHPPPDASPNGSHQSPKPNARVIPLPDASRKPCVSRKPRVSRKPQTTNKETKQTLMSRIPGLTIADLRKCFDELRKTPIDQIHNDNQLWNGMYMGDFAILYVIHSTKTTKQ
jgi:hypothetical protein